MIGVYTAAGIDGDNPFTPEEAEVHWAGFKRYPNYRLFVASLDGVIVGAYSLLILDKLAKRGQPSGIVEDVAVSPDHQGRGIGRVMMEHAMAQCRLAGCYKLALSSNVRRQSAHEFYEAIGFKRHGYSFVVEP